MFSFQSLFLGNKGFTEPASIELDKTGNVLFVLVLADNLRNNWAAELFGVVERKGVKVVRLVVMFCSFQNNLKKKWSLKKKTKYGLLINSKVRTKTLHTVLKQDTHIIPA